MDSSLLGTALLLPVLAMVAWSMIIFIWMFVVKVPAINKLSEKEQQSAIHTFKLANVLPSKVQAVTDNWNHLSQQPALFYALAFTGVLLGQDTTANLVFAWSFVTVRVVHSIYQSTQNNPVIRFVIFNVAQLTLVAFIINLIASLI